MYAPHREELEARLKAIEWYGRSHHRRRVLSEFSLDGFVVDGWKLLRARPSRPAETSHGKAGSADLQTLWSRGTEGDPRAEVLAVDVYVRPSVKAAHDQMFEVLGNVQSAEVERKTGAAAAGDVAFGLANTTVLFARANVTVWVRNAGAVVAAVGGVARAIDREIERRLESSEGPAGRRSGAAVQGGGSRRLERRAPEDIAQALEQIVSLMKETRGGLRAEQIRSALGMPSRTLRRVLDEGVSQKVLKVRGQKKAPTYSTS